MTTAAALTIGAGGNRLAGSKHLVLIAAAGALCLLFLAWIGWFGGPLYTDMPAAGPARPKIAAVVLSGDMGFRFGMASAVAARLAEHGIGVVGVNSLTFLRRPRSPVEAAALVAGAIARAEAMAPGSRLVLVGQSAGADMLAVGLSLLSPRLRRRIALVALVVPGRRARLQASPSELFPLQSPEFDAAPGAARLDWSPLLCIQGADEEDSLCPLLRQRNAIRVALPGGHPLHRDADLLTRVLLGGIERYVAPAAGDR